MASSQEEARQEESHPFAEVTAERPPVRRRRPRVHVTRESLDKVSHLSLRAAAAVLGVSRTTVKKLRHDNNLTPIPIIRKSKKSAITKKEITATFHLQQADAAKVLNICTKTLRTRCREVGIVRWPSKIAGRHIQEIEHTKDVQALVDEVMGGSKLNREAGQQKQTQAADGAQGRAKILQVPQKARSNSLLAAAMQGQTSREDLVIPTAQDAADASQLTPNPLELLLAVVNQLLEFFGEEMKKRNDTLKEDLTKKGDEELYMECLDVHEILYSPDAKTRLLDIDLGKAMNVLAEARSRLKKCVAKNAQLPFTTGCDFYDSYIPALSLTLGEKLAQELLRLHMIGMVTMYNNPDFLAMWLVSFGHDKRPLEPLRESIEKLSQKIVDGEINGIQQLSTLLSAKGLELPMQKYAKPKFDV
ncbi:RWP-RK domain-containing protein [Chloropicon primus]|uniref:RWP-RK domain-containing protein n=1 Tax=Chloropicon primus TaxID=1764295 RepID=A0A5B8ML12_9CHLO|nr:hypothetical protein A3770_05p36750 [Chloropicon primus]UPR00371.1 RWP-RK domain-containing protein [Chloropicon primus]|eukprot:QDZ21157.1 hypothetical protein A3770_05p36750 [Chloropicon primus]